MICQVLTAGLLVMVVNSAICVFLYQLSDDDDDDDDDGGYVVFEGHYDHQS